MECIRSFTFFLGKGKQHKTYWLPQRLALRPVVLPSCHLSLWPLSVIFPHGHMYGILLLAARYCSFFKSQFKHPLFKNFLRFPNLFKPFHYQVLRKSSTFRARHWILGKVYLWIAVHPGANHLSFLDFSFLISHTRGMPSPIRIIICRAFKNSRYS